MNRLFLPLMLCAGLAHAHESDFGGGFAYRDGEVVISGHAHLYFHDMRLTPGGKVPTVEDSFHEAIFETPSRCRQIAKAMNNVHQGAYWFCSEESNK